MTILNDNAVVFRVSRKKVLMKFNHPHGRFVPQILAAAMAGHCALRCILTLMRIDSRYPAIMGGFALRRRQIDLQ